MKQLLVVVLLIAGASSLNCYCENNCGPPPTCQGSVINDICGCCKRCAKVNGEKCGGLWSMSGVCDTGLVCHKELTARKVDGSLKLWIFSDSFNAEGICGPPKELTGHLRKWSSI